MRAKMSPEQKPPQVATYLCIWCDTEFSYEDGEFACPDCGNKDPRDLIVIHMVDDPAEHALYCPIDFQGG
jgi:Zn finger protein HypA/HybF involved in hydrogenase expression